MTKTVRIENADTANFKVKVDVYDMAGATPDPKADTLVKTIDLDYPTAMTGPHEYLTSTRYMLVREG